MTFLSVPFLLLFAGTFVLLLLFKKQTCRQVILLAASYIFYAWWDVRFLSLLIFQTLVVYTAALIIEQKRNTSPATARRAVCIAVAVCLGVLGFFKYFHFFTGSITRLFGEDPFSSLYIILPVGISFYTFQCISYVVDVYRQKVTARRSFLKVALYISFFPQLVAGPIIRSSDFLPQLDHNPAITGQNFAEGCQIFLFGAIKKAVVADRLSVCVDAVFAAPQSYSGWSILGAVIAYSIQIYCDFSGYSDMAVGVARALGYNLCRNFNLPYLSRNLTEFWKRWHISLSQWLQDYLYIPLGGNRKGRVRTYVNLMLTMVLGGLWHGASWNFVFWGFWHGVGLVAHKLFMASRRNRHAAETVTPDVLRSAEAGGHRAVLAKVSGILRPLLCILATYSYVCVGWIFFRADSFGTACTILHRIFTFAEGISYTYVYTVIFTLALLIIHVYCCLRTKKEGIYILLDWNKFLPKVIFVLGVLLAAAFAYQGNQAFIYFQF